MASLSYGKLVVAKDLKEWRQDESRSNSPEMVTTDVDPSSMTANRDSSELPIDMAEWSPDEVAAYTALRSKRKKCCVGGCTHRSLPIARSYHQLPMRNKDVWAKWIEVIRWSRNEPEWSPNGDAAPLVCSRHFSDSDFISYEASSRVRLSHTAIPIYFVDPPDGTSMDPRFSNPLPIPPITSGPRQKDTPKSKNKILKQEQEENDQMNGQYGSSSSSSFSSSPQYRDNLGYDIEEVAEENDETGDESLGLGGGRYNTPHQFPFLSLNAILSGAGSSSNNSSIAIQQPSNHHRIRNLKYASSSSKPPALIRAKFIPLKDNVGHVNPIKKFRNNGSNVTISKVGLPLPAAQTNLMKPKVQPMKHKIGLAKCRLIVQTLQNQLKIAKMRLAEQLGVPFQVVHGVWDMRDSLKDKL